MYVCFIACSSASTHMSLQVTWDTPGFREFHRRMQLFILLFVEGGSYIQEDEDTWEFVVLSVFYYVGRIRGLQEADSRRDIELILRTRHIASLATRHYTPFTVTPRKSDFG
jgi:hypothetical protein